MTTRIRKQAENKELYGKEPENTRGPPTKNYEEPIGRRLKNIFQRMKE